MLERALRWWTSNLLPKGLRARLWLDRPTLRLALVDGALHHGWGRAPLRPSPAGSALARRVARRRARVELVVGAERIVDRRQTLPLRAAGDLSSVLRLALPTMTPFAAEDVYWTHRIVGTDRAGGKLTVALSLAPAAAFAPEMAAAGEAGLVVDHLRVAPEGPLLVRERAVPAAASRRAARLLIAGAVCAVLAAGLLVRDAERDLRGVAEAAEARAASLRTALGTAGPNTDDADAGTRIAAGRLDGRVPAVEVLARLTTALPDEAMVTRVVLRDDVLDLTGFARDAAALVPRLDDVRGFASPTFAAPVRAEPGTGRERYALRLALEPLR